MYTRGAIGTVVELVYESPAPEDEAWDNTDKSEWFYSINIQAKGHLAGISRAYMRTTH